VNAILDNWNTAPESEAMNAMLACCGARRWAAAVIAQRPYVRLMDLRVTADIVWANMGEVDWLEAFACHPRIGERCAKQGQSSEWSNQEQSSVGSSDKELLDSLAAANQQYERRFGFTCIICSADKSAPEILSILSRRLESSRDAELSEAAEQQRQIMQIRISKWLGL